MILNERAYFCFHISFPFLSHSFVKTCGYASHALSVSVSTGTATLVYLVTFNSGISSNKILKFSFDVDKATSANNYDAYYAQKPKGEEDPKHFKILKRSV